MTKKKKKAESMKAAFPEKGERFFYAKVEFFGFIDLPIFVKNSAKETKEIGAWDFGLCGENARESALAQVRWGKPF